MRAVFQPIGDGVASHIPSQLTSLFLRGPLGMTGTVEIVTERRSLLALLVSRVKRSVRLG